MYFICSSEFKNKIHDLIYVKLCEIIPVELSFIFIIYKIWEEKYKKIATFFAILSCPKYLDVLMYRTAYKLGVYNFHKVKNFSKPWSS